MQKNNNNLGEIIRANLDGIKKVVKTDQDFLIVVEGYEGSGKSTLAIECAEYIDPNFTNKKINMTGDDFLMNLESFEKYSGVMLDEGASSLMARRSTSKENVELVKTLTQIRAK